MATDTATGVAIDAAHPPGMPASALRLAIPPGGLTDGHVLLREISVRDVDDILPAFTDPELREAGNLPNFSRDEMLASLPHMPALAASGRLLPLAAVDTQTTEIVGGGMLHHLDAERSIVELAYWLLPHARGCGFATRIARLLGWHSFALGVERVAAYVNVGNRDSERVLERRVHPRGRRAVVAEAGRAPRRQDALLVAARRALTCGGITAPALHWARHSGASQPSMT